MINMSEISVHDPYGYGVLIEHLIDRVDLVLEQMSDMHEKVNRIPFIEARLDEHDKKFEIVITAIKDISKTINGQESEFPRWNM